MRNPESSLQPTPEITRDTASTTESAREPIPTREVLRDADATIELLRNELDALVGQLRAAEQEQKPKSLLGRVFKAAPPKTREVLLATIARRRFAAAFKEASLMENDLLTFDTNPMHTVRFKHPEFV